MIRSSALIPGSSGRWRIAAAGLAVAALVVGAAISMGGEAARTLNGIGAAVWLASAWGLAVMLPAAPRRSLGWVAAVVAGVALGAIIRPGTIPEAIVWFAIAGALVAVAAADTTGAWALLVPAIYLPVHLAIGIGRAMFRGGAVRTEPPPTPAVLPLLMIVAAGIAGWLVGMYLRRQGAS